MIFKKIHDTIPLKALFLLFTGLSIFIQLTVISYSHLSGYYVVESFFHFLSKMAMGTSLTFLALIFIAYPDLYIIWRLNTSLSWNKKPMSRLIIQVLATIVIAVIISVCITLFAHGLKTYAEPLQEVLINNALIFSVCNILLMALLEAWVFFIEKNRINTQSLNLQKEVSKIRFELLKTQINPHFMFNSLNVLSGLIESDTEKAQTFIDEFSQIYRYVLETIDQQIVTVEEELRFARSYISLQQIRYGNDLHFSVDLPSHVLKKYIPPLSLQVVLENAIKHNQVNPEKPLHIEIRIIKDKLNIRNSWQPKSGPVHTTGIGQKNLRKRYQMIGRAEPEFRVGTKEYEVLLPLIDVEKDEYPDH